MMHEEFCLIKQIKNLGKKNSLCLLTLHSVIPCRYFLSDRAKPAKTVGGENFVFFSRLYFLN